MLQFAISKRWKPDRVVPLVAGRKGMETELRFIEHIVQRLSIVRGGGIDRYTREFAASCPPLPELSLADVPAWADADKHITKVIKAKRDILIYGDYDCDGVCSTTLMLDYLECAGLSHKKCHWFIPNRFNDKYGLTMRSLENVLTEMKVKPALLIAVDCGSPSKVELEYLREQHISTIVIDHHPVEPTGSAHPADVHLNPKGWPELRKRKDLNELCAAGLVFLFCRAMAKHNSLENWDVDRATILAGLATCADVVPIFRLNRTLVKRAIALYNQSANSESTPVPGLLELHQQFYQGHQRKTGRFPDIDEATLGFEWAPCINATGRLDEARQSLELLRVRDPELAKPIADECRKMNQRRSYVQRRILEEARRQALSQVGNFPPAKVILAVGKHWNIGVVGVVAGRLREEFERPAIVCGMDETGTWRGSGRSVDGFDMGGAFRRASQPDGDEKAKILAGGGHKMAGALSFQEEQRPDFHNWMNDQCTLSESDFIHTAKVVALAEEFPPNWWSYLLSELRPFGQGHGYTPILLHDAWLENVFFGKFRNDLDEPDVDPEDKKKLPDLFAIGRFQPRSKPNARISAFWRDCERARREWRHGRCYTLELDVRLSRRREHNFVVLECWPEGERKAQPAYDQVDLTM